MKVLGIIGSKRKKGNTAMLVKSTLETIEKHGIETETVYLSDYNIAGCNGCEGCKDTYQCVINDDMQKLYPKIMESDAIVMGSPTYFYNISSDTKAFLERCYNYEIFDKDDRSVWLSMNEVLGGKYAVVIAICEQDNEHDMGFTAEAMSLPLQALGYRVVDSVKVLNLFKKEDPSHIQVAIGQAQKAGDKLAKTMKLRKEVEIKLEKMKI